MVTAWFGDPMSFLLPLQQAIRYFAKTVADSVRTAHGTNAYLMLKRAFEPASYSWCRLEANAEFLNFHAFPPITLSADRLVFQVRILKFCQIC